MMCAAAHEGVSNLLACSPSQSSLTRCHIPHSVANATSLPGRGESFLKGRDFGSLCKVSGFARGSPFGRAVTRRVTERANTFSSLQTTKHKKASALRCVRIRQMPFLFFSGSLPVPNSHAPQRTSFVKQTSFRKDLIFAEQNLIPYFRPCRMGDSGL